MLIQVLAALLPIQVPANALGKEIKAGPSPGTPAVYMEDPDGVPGWLRPSLALTFMAI